MLVPFDYQVAGIDQCREEIRKGKRSLIICMLMGAGKSLMAFELMRLCCDKGKRSLFICDRRMLADQAAERARQHGLHVGVIQAGRPVDIRAPVQFAMKQTLVSWIKKDKISLPEFDLIIADECHRCISKEYLDLFARWPNAIRIGLTATPCLGNGGGMGKYYDGIIQPIMPSKLLEIKRTVPVRAFGPHKPNLSKVKKDKDGDYSTAGVSEVLQREHIIGDIAGWWKSLGDNRPSIYFACDVADALAIRDEFRGEGVTAEMICDETPDEERDDIRRRSESGDVKVVVNVDVLSEGVDWPWVSCIGLVRPTKRLRRYLQNAGRGMRAYDGKIDCILIDHSGCVDYHGYPDIDILWPLDPLDNADKANQEKQKNQPATIRCVKCTAMFKGSRTCPECGHIHVIEKKARERAKGNGTLVELSRDVDMPQDALRTLRQRFWGTCIGVAVKSGKTAGMAAGMFSSKFGLPPWQAKVTPLAEGREWKEPAALVFPGFVRGKAKGVEGDAFEFETAGER